MFGLFKKKDKEAEKPVQKELSLHAVADGEVVTIDKVNDQVFSQKFMGDGYAVVPTGTQVTAPVSGTILNVFPTKHAVGIKADNGVEVLLHMGVDTVELKGEAFEVHVAEGDHVTPDTVVADVDLEMIKAAGKGTELIVVLTNMDDVENFTVAEGQNTGKAEIGHVRVK